MYAEKPGTLFCLCGTPRSAGGAWQAGGFATPKLRARVTTGRRSPAGPAELGELRGCWDLGGSWGIRLKGKVKGGAERSGDPPPPRAYQGVEERVGRRRPAPLGRAPLGPRAPLFPGPAGVTPGGWGRVGGRSPGERRVRGAGWSGSSLAASSSGVRGSGPWSGLPGRLLPQRGPEPWEAGGLSASRVRRSAAAGPGAKGEDPRARGGPRRCRRVGRRLPDAPGAGAHPRAPGEPGRPSPWPPKPAEPAVPTTRPGRPGRTSRGGGGGSGRPRWGVRGRLLREGALVPKPHWLSRKVALFLSLDCSNISSRQVF